MRDLRLLLKGLRLIESVDFFLLVSPTDFLLWLDFCLVGASPSDFLRTELLLFEPLTSFLLTEPCNPFLLVELLTRLGDGDNILLVEFFGDFDCLLLLSKPLLLLLRLGLFPDAFGTGDLL